MTQTIINLQQLYKDYQQDVFRFSFWLSGQVEEAQDITAETFIRVLTAKNELNATTVKGYLLTIARNIYLQRLRKYKKEVEVTEEYIDQAPSLENVIHSKFELLTIIKALQALPELDRTILIMKSYEGLPYSEVSQLLNIPISLLKVKVHRIRKVLTRSHLRGESI